MFRIHVTTNVVRLIVDASRLLPTYFVCLCVIYVYIVSLFDDVYISYEINLKAECSCYFFAYCNLIFCGWFALCQQILYCRLLLNCDYVVDYVANVWTMTMINVELVLFFVFLESFIDDAFKLTIYEGLTILIIMINHLA